MIFHENLLLADDSHEIACLIFLKIRKDVAKFVACCSRDWGLKRNVDSYVYNKNRIRQSVVKWALNNQ